MIAFGPHSGFVLLAWAAAAAAVGALIVWVVLDHRAQRRALAALERKDQETAR